jgi:hypothetical protein
MWTREQTQEWIAQVELRIGDMNYYLSRMVEWCELNGIWSDDKVTACSIVTVIWVSHMRGEPVSRREIFEILGHPDWEEFDDAEYYLNASVLNKDLEELLEEAVQSFDD